MEVLANLDDIHCPTLDARMLFEEYAFCEGEYS